MSLLRSALFALLFYPITALAVLMALPIAAMGRGPLLRIVMLWALWHRWSAKHILGIRTRIEGSPPQGPVLVAVKHQSMFETLEMVLLLNEPAVVLKRELADIPGWGRVARRYGVIPVDRSGGAAALRPMLRAARAALAEGRQILIFPEGTRVAPGEQPPLQAGFAGLYQALGVPVVPIALDSGRVWPRRAFIKRPGVVTIRVGDEIPPGLPRREAEALVHAAINALETRPAA